MTSNLKGIHMLHHHTTPDIFENLLVLGRPASGKSEFIDFMARVPPAERAARYFIGDLEVLDDFPILWQIFRDDDIRERLGRPRLYSFPPEDNYGVADPFIWDFLIERINDAVRERYLPNPDFYERHTLLVEFSRGGDAAYRKALNRLEPQLLARAAILYIEVSFEESLRRNAARFDQTQPGGILTHSVSEEQMRTVYRHDDWPILTGGQRAGYLIAQGIKVPYVTMHNEPESTDPVVLDRRYGEALRELKRLYDQRAVAGG